MWKEDNTSFRLPEDDGTLHFDGLAEPGLRRAFRQQDPPEPTPDETDIRFGDDPLQTYDVYYAAEAPESAPTVVLVHGGGWTTGDKSNDDVTQAAMQLRDSGSNVVVTNYRLVSDTTTPEDAAQDVADATAHFCARFTEEFGDAPSSVYFMGHSAGAHISLLAGMDPNYLAKAGFTGKISGIIGLDSDALDIPQEIADAQSSGNWIRHQMLINAHGRDPEAWENLSPRTHISEDDPPILLISSSDRTAGNEGDMQKFVDDVQGAGGHARLAPPVEDTITHDNILEHVGARGSVTAYIRSFIRDTIRLDTRRADNNDDPEPPPRQPLSGDSDSFDWGADSPLAEVHYDPTDWGLTPS